MAKLQIRVYPDPALKKKAEPVTEFDDSLRRLAADMAETMYANDGVGLAAPQVGVSRRFLVLDVGPTEERGKNLLVLANPRILLSDGDVEWDEGCLSLPGMSVKVHRKAHVQVEAQDLNGQVFRIDADQLLAVAVQHEMDHLEGTLLLDHASALKRRLLIRDYNRNRMKEDSE
jgi:peptide deformylase